MNFKLILDNYFAFWTENLFLSIFIHFFLILLCRRLINNFRSYFGTKGFAEKSNRLRRKKFNGIDLVKLIKRKDKKKRNTYKEMPRSVKIKVEDYFRYKENELPGVTNYSFGKMFKKSKHHVLVYVSDGNKRLMSIKMKGAHKKFIKLSNEHECLDDIIVYLHHLPEAILNRQNYIITLRGKHISIGYEIV